MISLLDEKLLTLHDAARLLPGNRAGKPVNFSTVWRWILRGVSATNGARVKLEAARVGGRWLTSREALARFSAALTPPAGSTVPTQSPSMRSQSHQAAKRKLEKKSI